MLLPLTITAQEWKVIKGDCTPGLVGGNAETRPGVGTSGIQALSKPVTDWDANKTYKQLVVLVSFSDTDFQNEYDKTFYERMFNEQGFNNSLGKGSVTDYFRDQSGGQFNLEFDVFGPYKVSTKAQPYENPTASTRNYGSAPMREATQMMMEENKTWDFKQYDWNGDGKIEQVIYVFAGLSGNQSNASCYGFVWPNTSIMTSIETPDGMIISAYTNSCELWTNNSSCGIGTICHEFSHSLGLPDIYPTGGSSGFYSVCDEWDLMDGGNFTNRGWCPPNYTAQEKMYMGWVTPVELTEPTTVTDMKSISDGGEIYMIRHTDTEYLLLENRQRTGWDAGTPGRGLVITHVDFSQGAWESNTVNATAENSFRVDIVHADNMHYEEWDRWMIDQGFTSAYANASRMNNWHLSTSPFPWSTDSTEFVNDALTDTSTPAAKMYHPNAADKTLLGKAITNIKMSEDGLISFDFMGGNQTGIRSVHDLQSAFQRGIYDLQGRKLDGMPQKRGLYIIHGKKVIIH